MACVNTVALFLIWSPVQAFIQSNTGYARIASAANIASYTSGNRAAVISQVAAAAATSGASSVAVRIVAGANFATIGVFAGMAIYEYLYTSSDLAQVKSHAAPPGSWTLQNFSHPITSAGPCPDATAQCPSGYKSWVWTPNTGTYGTVCALYSGNPLYLYPGPPTGYTAPSGWTNWTGRQGYAGCFSFQPNADTGPTPVYTQQPPTQQQMQTYLTNLAPGAPYSVEAETIPLGQGATVPNADVVTVNPVDPTVQPTSVVPAGNVGAGDAVLNPNAPAPTNTTITNNTTQTNTTTTTTTTNTDGSVTQQATETATASCSTTGHDQRTMGSVLQSHLTAWNGSALLGALTTLKTLTWPSTMPTYTLQSSLLGTFNFDFSAWSTSLLALRSLIIAVASFVAYRIVFVGSK